MSDRKTTLRQSDGTATAVGEVIEAGTMQFVAQCPRDRLHEPPEFGAFVKVLPPGVAPGAASGKKTAEEEVQDLLAESAPRRAGALPSETAEDTLYALVYRASTGSADIGRRPAAYGLSEAQLQEEQPQIFNLLATEFAALHIGYARAARVQSSLPPRPPRLHAFVYDCSPEEVCALTDAPDFVRPLLNLSGDAGPDALIAACLRNAYAQRSNDFAFLVRVGKQLAALLRDDPERLAALLRKLEP